MTLTDAIQEHEEARDRRDRVLQELKRAETEMDVEAGVVLLRRAQTRVTETSRMVRDALARGPRC